MKDTAIRFTTQGDYACSYCGYLIPRRGDVLQDWVSADVAGMFCSKSHAEAATCDLSYRSRWAFVGGDGMNVQEETRLYEQAQGLWEPARAALEGAERALVALHEALKAANVAHDLGGEVEDTRRALIDVRQAFRLLA